MATAREIESVWDYPRPPRLERTGSPLIITHCGIVLANTTHALRILETSHPPVYYIPPADIAMQFVRPSTRRGSFCEFKGVASYWDVAMSDTPDTSQRSCVSLAAAWSYSDPSAAYAMLRDHLAFYASKLDECTVDGERVSAQDGDFYGGWITSSVIGPCKGAPGTLGW
jgi:uncharacterized protein (DUF427 family)